MSELLRTFGWSIAAAVAAVAAAFVYNGGGAAALVAVLIVLEGSISFDNAIVNATVLRRMNPTWQRAFLTVGIAIAVFGMRVVFPIAIVAVATSLGPIEVAELALEDKAAYADKVERAAPIIGAFGGTFLLMVALNFFLDPQRERHWLGPLERPLASAGELQGLATALTVVTIITVSQLVATASERDVLLAGLVGLATYLLIRGLSQVLSARQEGAGRLSGGAGLAAFLYLEMLDASFSLDGVLGAFAITKDIVLIALGLGVGALLVRSLTVYLVRRETLQEYPYLEHGAHWAIAALAVVLYLSIEVHVPEWLTATIGLTAIAAALISSVRVNRREGEG